MEHYRRGRNKEAIVDALKAFESTIKVICAERKWPDPPNATVGGLIEVVFREGLLPEYLLSEFTGLRSVVGGHEILALAHSPC